MKTGILLTSYNRQQYLKETLWCLERLELPENTSILLIDDYSSDPKVKELLHQTYCRLKNITLWLNDKNNGVKQTLLTGYERLFASGCDLVINFDSDCLIRPDCVTKLINTYVKGKIFTAFHSTTKNANGTDRHKIITDGVHVCYKQSVGGINFCIDKTAYENFVKPALLQSGNWDHNSCINAGGAYCLKPSLVEHIGFDSSLNHTEQPDVADNFYYWHLPDVTLLCVDNQPSRIQSALKACTKYIKFGDIKLLHPDIRSKEAYSNYIINEAHKHVNTSHVLIFQHDGYVNNWKAWDDDWLQYDYIGAPWHYMDGFDVGNGGFSLRSKRLMELCAEIVKTTHPEDHHICRTYRRELERRGMKFAPREVAEKFSFEGYLQPTKVLSDQFGRHGSNPRRTVAAPVTRQRYVVNQFLSLGDILFLVPLIRALMAEGNAVLWPIDDKYLPIRKHFRDINFVPKSQYNLPYEHMGMVPTPHGTMIPYRFASELMRRSLKDCMRSKYELYGHDHSMWRLLTWERDFAAEHELCKLLDLPPKFVLVNRYYGHNAQMQISPKLPDHTPIVEMRNIDWFTLIDWLGVIEKASEVHASNSALSYLLELMDLKCPVYLYPRNVWGESGFEYTQQLLTNKAFIFNEQ